MDGFLFDWFEEQNNEDSVSKNKSITLCFEEAIHDKHLENIKLYFDQLFTQHALDTIPQRNYQISLGFEHAVETGQCDAIRHMLPFYDDYYNSHYDMVILLDKIQYGDHDVMDVFIKAKNNLGSFFYAAVLHNRYDIVVRLCGQINVKTVLSNYHIKLCYICEIAVVKGYLAITEYFLINKITDVDKMVEDLMKLHNELVETDNVVMFDFLCRNVFLLTYERLKTSTVRLTDNQVSKLIISAAQYDCPNILEYIYFTVFKIDVAFQQPTSMDFMKIISDFVHAIASVSIQHAHVSILDVAFRISKHIRKYPMFLDETGTAMENSIKKDLASINDMLIVACSNNSDSDRKNTMVGRILEMVVDRYPKITIQQYFQDLEQFERNHIVLDVACRRCREDTVRSLLESGLFAKTQHNKVLPFLLWNKKSNLVACLIENSCPEDLTCLPNIHSSLIGSSSSSSSSSNGHSTNETAMDILSTALWRVHYEHTLRICKWIKTMVMKKVASSSFKQHQQKRAWKKKWKTSSLLWSWYVVGKSILARSIEIKIK